jgi:hypothetical protein
MNFSSLLVRITLLTVPVLAVAGDARPRCDAKHLGQFWPEPKNGSVSNVEKLAQSGELQVCSRDENWRYGWERLTITVDQLKPERKKATAPTSSTHP